MTPRDLFAIILKSIGLYLVIGGFVSIPQIIYSFYTYQHNGASLSDILEICFFILFSISFYIGFLYLCLFRTDWVIDRLHLSRGFGEERLGINFHRSTVLRIIVILLGAVMITDSLPLLCKNILTYLQTTTYRIDFKENIASGWLIFYFVKFFLGFCFISASRPIVNFIELKRKNPPQRAEE